MKLRCICCGHEREFADAEDAFKNGWDAPPHFTAGPFCDLCPASLHVMGITHEPAHMRWMLNGRPAEFSPATCGSEKELR